MTGGTVNKRFFGQGEQVAGSAYYFARDHLGSIREMTDTNGTVRARYEYDPYGRRTKVSGDMEADFGFTGHYYHRVSGLHLAPYRAYHAETARWINRDPISEGGGLNLYAYAGNNPVNYVDYLGLSFVGKVVVFVVKGTTKGEKVISKVDNMQDAIRLQQEGEEIVMSSEKLARELAREAGGGATPIKEFDQAAQRWHYHPADRSGGHILYGVAGALTLAHYAKGKGKAVECVGTAADLFNPLSLGQDLLDIYDLVNSAFK